MNAFGALDAQTCREIIEHLPNVAILLFDLDLRYTFATGEALAELGVTPEQLIGSLVGETSGIASWLTPEARSCVDTPREIFNLQYTVGDRTYEMQLVPRFARDGAGEVIGGLMTTRDISHRRRNEQHATGLLRESNEAFRKENARLRADLTELRKAMADGPPKYKTDPNCPWTPEEMRALEASLTTPEPQIAEKLVDAMIGPTLDVAEDPREAVTLIECPACSTLVRHSAISPAYIACKAKADAFDADIARAKAQALPLDRPELDEDEETRG